MKKLLLTTIILCFSIMSQAQVFQFSTVTKNDSVINSAMRYSWRIPFRFELKEFKNKNKWYGAVNLKNEGIIFDQNTDRVVMRGIFLGLESGFVFHIKNLAICPSAGIDYQLHYKEKVFRDKSRSNKDVTDREWSSDKISKYNYFARLGIGKKDGLMLFTEVYFANFFNPNYTEEVNGQKFRPFDGMKAQRFNIGLSYIFDGDSNKRQFSSKENQKEEPKEL